MCVFVCLREREFCVFGCVRGVCKGVVFFNDDFLSNHFFFTFPPHSSIRSIRGFISKPFCCLFGNFFSSFSIERECLERSLTMTSKAVQVRAGFSIQGSFSPEILITCQHMPLRLTFAFYCFRKKEQLDVSTGNNVTSFRFVSFRANEQSDVIKQTNVKRGLKFACCSDRFIENYKLQKNH